MKGSREVQKEQRKADEENHRQRNSYFSKHNIRINDLLNSFTAISANRKYSGGKDFGHEFT